MRQTDNYCSVHISDLESLPKELFEKVNRAVEVFRTEGSGTFQVVSVSKVLDQVQLLCYPKFWDQIFPELKESWIITFMDGGTRVVHDVCDARNPPILHHKEEYIKEQHESVPELRAITREFEAAGCFEIPIENRNQWIETLIEKGVEFGPLSGGRG
jgi:hypothetical protein